MKEFPKKPVSCGPHDVFWCVPPEDARILGGILCVCTTTPTEDLVVSRADSVLSPCPFPSGTLAVQVLIDPPVYLN
jgi:hypothetical protein